MRRSELIDKTAAAMFLSDEGGQGDAGIAWQDAHEDDRDWFRGGAMYAVDALLAAGKQRWMCETGPIALPEAEVVEGCQAEDCPVCEGGQIFQQHTGPISWWVCPVCERPTHATACGWVVVLDVDTEDN